MSHGHLIDPDAANAKWTVAVTSFAFMVAQSIVTSSK
jgi:hypothetical protein